MQEPQFKIGQIVMDLDTGETGEIIGMEYEETLEEWVYEPSFCDETEIYLDVALVAVWQAAKAQ